MYKSCPKTHRDHLSKPEMDSRSILLLSILATFSVWAVSGRTFQISSDDEKLLDMDLSAEAQGLPGKCWACKWILGKMKKFAGPNATAKSLMAKLKSICKEIGLLKSLCNYFVEVHLGELVEELTTTDDVRTICVNTGACKPKELLNLQFSSRK
ncbi:uncharacterized protein KZ484_012571 [Pholidichthys leucotaenia]